MKNVVFLNLIVLSCLACGKTNLFVDGEKAKVEKLTPEEINTAENSDSLADPGNEEANSAESADATVGTEITIEAEVDEESDSIEESSKDGMPEELAEEVSEEEAVDAKKDSEILALSCSEALSLTEMEASNVVYISSQGKENIKLTPDTIIVLNLSGQADIELDSDEIKQIKGLCINASGGSRTSIEIDFHVEEMNYYGRGNALTTLDFDNEGTFASISVDISGTHDLNIYGEKIDCSLLEKMETGSGLVHCDSFTN